MSFSYSCWANYFSLPQAPEKSEPALGATDGQVRKRAGQLEMPSCNSRKGHNQFKSSTHLNFCNKV